MGCNPSISDQIIHVEMKRTLQPDDSEANKANAPIDKLAPPLNTSAHRSNPAPGLRR